MRRLRFVFFLTTVSLIVTGCSFSFQSWELGSANKDLAAGRKKEALAEFVKTVKMDPSSKAGLEAAERGASLAYLEMKNYQAAIQLYKSVILYSPDEEQRKSAQKYIAQIYFENILDYHQAIVEYAKLLRLPASGPEKVAMRLRIAKAQYRLGNSNQALAELKSIEARPLTKDRQYDVSVLKAEILMAQKKYEDAATVLEETLKKFPERAQKQNLGFTLVVCYQDLKKYQEAIHILENMKGYAHPEFVEDQIKRLKQRIANLPAKLRK